MLHIVNKSPLEKSSLDACLGVAQSGAALLLTEDAVYAATEGHAAAGKIRAVLESIKVYVLSPDLEARGMAGATIDGVTPVDYGGFVDLVVEHKNSLSWL